MAYIESYPNLTKAQEGNTYTDLLKKGYPSGKQVSLVGNSYPVISKHSLKNTAIFQAITYKMPELTLIYKCNSLNGSCNLVAEHFPEENPNLKLKAECIVRNFKEVTGYLNLDYLDAKYRFKVGVYEGPLIKTSLVVPIWSDMGVGGEAIVDLVKPSIKAFSFGFWKFANWYRIVGKFNEKQIGSLSAFVSLDNLSAGADLHFRNKVENWNAAIRYILSPALSLQVKFNDCLHLTTALNCKIGERCDFNLAVTGYNSTPTFGFKFKIK